MNEDEYPLALRKLETVEAGFCRFSFKENIERLRSI
jgi:hypothetical protein